jgi:threonine dehydratase
MGEQEPTLADVEAAARRIAGTAVRTPLLESHALNDRVGRRVLIKPETLQRTGSFKFRGAMSRLSRIPESERQRGVVAFSSGNHAQGVAAAAALLGVPATIVMPNDAPEIKRRKTASFGARIVGYDRKTEDREAMAAAIVAESGAILVPPFDHPDIIAGQGTIGLEIAQQAAELEAEIVTALVPCGGGGLIAGTATALKALIPDISVYAVEPFGWDDTRRSLESGERQRAAGDVPTLCDALLAPTPGALTFAINKRLLSGGLAVTDEEVVAAMAYGFDTLKLVIEPGGAVALAALLAGHAPATGAGAVAIVLSGGNVDARQYARAIVTQD